MRDILTDLLCTFFSAWALTIVAPLSPRSIFLVPASAGIYLLFRHLRVNGIKGKGPAVLAFFFTGGTILARYREITESYESALFRTLTLAIAFAGLFMLLYALIAVTAQMLSETKTETWLHEDTAPANAFSRLFDRHPLLVPFVLIVLCRLPWFLYGYPGIINPDAVDQLTQAAGKTPLVNAHPVTHTLILRFFLWLGSVSKDPYQTGTALYTLAQILFIAYAAAYAVNLLKKLRFRRSVCYTALVFYALLPFMNVYAVTVWKDAPFAASLIFLSAMLLRMTEENETEEGIRTQTLVRFALSLALSILLRANAWMMVLVPVPFLLYAYRRSWQRVLAALAIVIAGYALLFGPVFSALQIESADFIEKWNIPPQQIARVIVEEKELSEHDEALIRDVLGDRDVALWYDPYYADTMKAMVRTGDQEALRAHKGTYASLYLRLGLRYPATYLRAWGDMTRAMLFPDLDYGIAEQEEVADNDLGIRWSPVIISHGLLKLRELVTRLPYRVPLLSFLWSCGCYTWGLAFTVLCLMRQKERRKWLSVCAPSLAVLFTMLVATPISTEFRYVYGIVMCAPLWALAPYLSKKECANQS